MSKIHEWQSAPSLARQLGVSVYIVHNNTPSRIESRELDAAMIAARRAEMKGRAGGRVESTAYRVKPEYKSEDFARPRKQPRHPAHVEAPPPLPNVPPPRREPLNIQLKPEYRRAIPPTPPPFPDAQLPRGEAPITIMAPLITFLTYDPQSLTDQIALLISKAFPTAGVVTVAVGLDMEMYSARIPTRPDDPPASPSPPSTPADQAGVQPAPHPPR